MNIKIVVGANYGDEGKGLATDYFTQNAKGPVLNVLYNGGPQRGHTVEHKNGLRHIFHHYGSGFFSGAQTYFDKYFLIDPTKFNIEHCNLIDQAKHFTNWSIVDIVDKTICYAHPECRVITPWDVIAGQVITKGHSSCGAGIWQTIVRNCSLAHSSRSIGNLYDISEKARRRYFISVRDWWKDYYDLTKETLGNYADIYYSDGLLEHYLKDFNTMCRSKIVIATLEELLTEKTYDTIIFEGGQGLGLSGNTHGYFEGVNCFLDGLTPSDTSSYHPIKWIKENPKLIDISKDPIEIAYVTRTYFTRHGDGPLPNECSKEDLGINYMDITNQSNQFQGDLRYAPFCKSDFKTRVVEDYRKASNILESDIQKSIMITHSTPDLDLNMFPIEDFHKIYISKSPYPEDVKSDCE